MAKIKRICSIPDCGKKHFGHGLCNTHHVRWRTHGNLNGRQDGGTEYREAQKYFRDVVLAYEGTECLRWPFGTDADGYARINPPYKERGNKVTCVASRRICEEIYGPPPTPEHHAAHSCGKGHLACVAKRHLSWKTPTENMADKIIHGTEITKLTESQVLEIRAMTGEVSQREIGRRLGVAGSTIRDVMIGKSWRHT